MAVVVGSNVSGHTGGDRSEDTTSYYLEVFQKTRLVVVWDTVVVIFSKETDWHQHLCVFFAQKTIGYIKKKLDLVPPLINTKNLMNKPYVSKTDEDESHFRGRGGPGFRF